MPRFSASTALQLLRTAKHRGMLLRRSVPHGLDRFWDASVRHRSFHYDPSRYRELAGGQSVPVSTTFFLDHLAHPEQGLQCTAPTGPAPYRLFVVWAGENPMTPARRAAWERLRQSQADLEVVLVGPENLADWILPEHPLHRAYSRLSHVHRADYLRAYLMHHHGGAYLDLKATDRSFRPVLERLNSDPGLWGGGAPEPSSTNVCGTGPMLADARRWHSKIVFQAAMAFKPGSRWTEEWLAEVERRLDYYDSLLHPGCVVQPFGENPEYPVVWNSLLGQVFTPLSLKYAEHAFTVPGFRLGDLSGGHR